MKAAYIERTGRPNDIQYGDLPDPSPSGSEVLIRTGAVAVNPIDTYIRGGMVAIDLPKPYVVGCDVAGRVEAIGSDVKRFTIGDRVWGSNQGLAGRQGTFSELVCSHEDWLYHSPDGSKDTTMAGIALVGITAHLGLFRRANLQPGETVFVNGGTGGVGSSVVQMCKAVGAQSIATVGSDKNADLCRSLGADLVLNYNDSGVDESIMEFTGDLGVDIWFETQRLPNFERSTALIRKGGRMIVMAGRDARPEFPVGPFYVKDLSLHGFAMFNASAMAQQRCADDINSWIEEKRLAPIIGRTLTLSQTAQAHELQESNTISKAGTLSGKIVLVPDTSIS